MHSSIKIQRTDLFEIVSNLAKQGEIAVILDKNLLLNQVLFILNDCFNKNILYKPKSIENLKKYLSICNTNQRVLYLKEEFDGYFYFNFKEDIDLPKIHYRKIYSKIPVFSLSKLKEMYESD